MPKPSTFHTIETMTAQSARLASSPNQMIGARDNAEIDKETIDQAKIVAEQPIPEQT